MNIEKAFSLADRDFDGLLSKKDLENFLINFLKIQQMDIDQAKIDRLFKLMDYHKKGVI